MTGLDATQNRLVEIACIVTENDLTVGLFLICQNKQVMSN
jgi:oligoribonuclease (3'-5' exoribonuclease)